MDFVYSVPNGQLVPCYDPLDPVIKDTGKDELPSEVMEVFQFQAFACQKMWTPKWILGFVLFPQPEM